MMCITEMVNFGYGVNKHLNNLLIRTNILKVAAGLECSIF